VKLRLHLVGDDVGKGGLTEAGGAKEQCVVECFAAVAGGSDEDPQIGGEAGLTDELCEVARSERFLEGTLFRLRFGGQDFISHDLTLPHHPHPPNRPGSGCRMQGAPIA
jgi:hypothetical protein